MERDLEKRSWWQVIIDTIRTLAALMAVGRFIAWLIRFFSGDPS